MIREEETFEKFGYHSYDLRPQSQKKIIASCDDCGKVRVTTKNAYRGFCGSCKQKGIRNHEYGKSRNCVPCGTNHYNWKGGKTAKCVCKICGAVFYLYPSQTKFGWGKYCSRSCVRKGKKFPQHHTKTEEIFTNICKKYNLHFQYVGDSSLWIGKKGGSQLNPDFIEANGKKICVEVMGDYWHSPLLNKNVQEYATLKYRKQHYKRFNWIPVFIWGTDLNREDAEEFVLKLLEKEAGVEVVEK